MTYRIDGMTCGGCARAITRALERAGIAGAAVDHEAGTATVPEGTDDAAVRKAVEGAGFTVVGPFVGP